MKFTEFILPLCFFITSVSKVNAACSERYYEQAHTLLTVGSIPTSSTVGVNAMAIAAGATSATVLGPLMVVGAGVSTGMLARGVRLKRLSFALAIAEGKQNELNERELSLGQSTLNKITRKVNRHSPRLVSVDEVVRILRPASLNNAICHQHDRLKGYLGIKKFILNNIE